MDVSRQAPERFRIWRGRSDNDARVLGGDARHRQLVLLVRERREPYEDTIPKHSLSETALQQLLRREGGRILAETSFAWMVRRWTTALERRYLCGFDEQHLFIAGIAAGDTIREAHDSLRPREVQIALRQRAAVVRQGEWFFIPLTATERGSLIAHLRCGLGSPQSESIGPGGQPHVAEQLVRVPWNRWPGCKPAQAEAVFARGAIAHPDHATLRLRDWHRVVRNSEQREAVIHTFRSNYFVD